MYEGLKFIRKTLYIQCVQFEGNPFCRTLLYYTKDNRDFISD